MSTLAPPAIPELPAGTVPVSARPRVAFSSVDRTAHYSIHDPPSAIRLVTRPARDSPALAELYLCRTSSCASTYLSLSAQDPSPRPRRPSRAVPVPLSPASGVDCGGEEECEYRCGFEHDYEEGYDGDHDGGDEDDEEDEEDENEEEGKDGDEDEEGEGQAEITERSYDKQWWERRKSLVVDELGRMARPLPFSSDAGRRAFGQVQQRAEDVQMDCGGAAPLGSARDGALVSHPATPPTPPLPPAPPPPPPAAVAAAAETPTAAIGAHADMHAVDSEAIDGAARSSGSGGGGGGTGGGHERTLKRKWRS